jgi:hypothetical protein
MTAVPIVASTTSAKPPLCRVQCPCGWKGNRRWPTDLECPGCLGPGEKIETLWPVGFGPHQSIIYLLHFHWPYGRVDPKRIRLADGSTVNFHADHYSGATRDLPRRFAEHLSGVFIPGRRGHRGRGARLVAAAIAYGADVRLARVWHVPLAFEQRLRPPKPSVSPQSENGQRFGAFTSLRPLCPTCVGDKAFGRFNEAKVQAYYREQRQAAEAERQARKEQKERWAIEHETIWNADREWDLAFPELAYEPTPATVAQG